MLLDNLGKGLGFMARQAINLGGAVIDEVTSVPGAIADGFREDNKQDKPEDTQADQDTQTNIDDNVKNFSDIKR